MCIEEHVALAPYTTLAVGGPARYFVAVESIAELEEALSFARAHGLSTFVLGGGSNIVVSDHGFDGLVVKNEIGGMTFGETGTVRAGAGVEGDKLVSASVARGLWGIESMSGIPGTVGAAIVGNIAAYGQAVSDTLQSVEIVDAASGGAAIERRAVSSLGLRYRYSDFQNSTLESKVILAATFQLSTSTTSELKYESALRVARELELNVGTLSQRRAVILEARRRAGSLLAGSGSEQPHTAGSFFRNPVVSPELAERLIVQEEFGISGKGVLRQNLVHGGSASRVSAAHVLLAAGFARGQTWGRVRLHPQHILKVENLGGATAQDIYEVTHTIVATVEHSLGVTLEPEVRFIGTFSKNLKPKI